jgi:cytoskeletal protein CcmA (bactofilin family)
VFAGKGDNEKLETIIGKNTQLDGNITTKGTLRIDGRMTGNVNSDWLILGEKSFLKGNANVGGIVVAGYIEGNINAKEFIEVKRSGQIKGDTVTNKLVVIEGGIIDGGMAMKKEGGKIVELNKDIIKEANK